MSTTKRKYSVTVTPDKDGEKFSPSYCDCNVCQNIHKAQLEWDTFIPNTGLQYRMKQVVKKIENDFSET